MLEVLAQPGKLFQLAPQHPTPFISISSARMRAYSSKWCRAIGRVRSLQPSLKSGFKEHLEQTKEHAQRLERVLSALGQTTRGPKCQGMEGIVAEGAEMIEEEGDDEVKDAGLIGGAQRVEHYEMAG